MHFYFFHFHTIMTISFKKSLAYCLLPVLLAACGGGSDKKDSTTHSNTISSTTVLEGYLDKTNISSYGFPWGSVSSGISKRWSLPIPVKTNGETRANPAMDAIEAKLGFTIFDRSSIANVPNHEIKRGLILSKTTAYLPAGANPQNYCANVSAGPFLGNYPYPQEFLLNTGEISTVLYINLDNPQCIASADIVIHEFGHALGLGSHFQGFGDGPAINNDFWVVLATLYGNPIGTLKANVLLKFPK